RQKRGSPAWQEIVATFGERVIGDSGEIDRRKLARAAFSDPAALERLNQITHPEIIRMVKDNIESCRQRGIKVVVVEAPLLFEAEWTLSVVDQVWLTVASEETIIRRLKEQKGLREELIKERLRHQLPPESKVGRATVVIDTDCDLEQLKLRVYEAWKKLGVS
ncbi:MAG: dephospho-CoA kinase, partial [Dehalococcoidia bacterium]|nr:dephospho-CoA kinase [Dehalococcoidia bacterium]